MIEVKFISLILLPQLSHTFSLVGSSFPRGGQPQQLHSSRRSQSIHKIHAHSSVISPFDPYWRMQSEGIDLGELFRVNQQESRHDAASTDHGEQDECCDDVSKLCRALGATPDDLLRLESSSDGVRGVFLNRSIKKGDVILSLPLDACLRDDSAPSWLPHIQDDEDVTATYNPSGWATRLAANLLDLQLNEGKNNDDQDIDGRSLWFSLLPDQQFLRASLPVHWSEDTVQSARSTALELAVDSSFFARAEAVEDLLMALKSNAALIQDRTEEQLRDMCNNALDLVQTRSCRLITGSDNHDSDIPLRVLAPIFDFINHGSIKINEGGATAQFQLEDKSHLVVRAIRDCMANEEVLIDYGDSARPAWKCLLSYGFVPQYNRIPGPQEAATVDSDDEDNLAEVYMDGVRYEVGPSQLPFDMVASAFRSDHPIDDDEEDGVALTPEVALKLANRISHWAYHLLLEPEQDLYDDHPSATPTLFQVISSREAASLRWSQHRVLVACALGLREFAADQTSYL